VRVTAWPWQDPSLPPGPAAQYRSDTRVQQRDAVQFCLHLPSAGSLVEGM